MVRTAFTISPLSIFSKATFQSRSGKTPPTIGATSRAPEPRSAITRSGTGQLWLKLPCSRTAFWTIGSYLRGRIALSGYGTAEDLRECIAYFQESIRRDPAFALGWAGLADVYTYLAMGESEAPARMVLSAREAAQRALQLEPGLAEGHTSLGIIKLMVDWDFPAAEAEFRRAIALSPGDIFALHWLAHYLETVGRYPEARVALRQAADLDPLSPMYQADLALQHYLMGEPRSALALAAELGAFSKPHALPGVLLTVALA